MPRRNKKPVKRYRKKAPVRKNKNGRRYIRRAAVKSGETKLQKQLFDEITNGVIHRNEAATLICPYSLDQTNVSPPTPITFPSTWNNTADNTQFYHNNFVSQGTAYNQRIGRRISAMSASVQLQFGFVPGDTTTTNEFPLYGSLRIIHGWCKEGVASLKDLLTDVPNMYSEVPYSKYKVLSDRVYMRKVHPAVSASTINDPPGEIGNYHPFKIKKSWYPKGRAITFTDSLSTVTYSGWTPFLLILNPHHGTTSKSLKLQFNYCKKLFAFKDA